MPDTKKVYYRRRKESLTWHTHKDCHKWPTEDYLEDEPEGDLKAYMVCRYCKRLEKDGSAASVFIKP